jgi:outer membrane lipoprotein-sorting protein
MATRRFAAVLGVIVVGVLLSGCVAFDSPSSDPNDPDDPDNPDPEAVFEGAFVHADNLEDVQGNRTTKVTNGSVTVTEVERVQKRPYVDERTEVLEASDSAAIGNIYVSNATMNWFYFPDSGVAQYFEPDEPFDDDAVRSDRAEIAAEKVEKYDLEYQGTEQIAGRDAHVLDVEAKNETVENGISAIIGDTKYVYALETSDPKEELQAVEQTLWIDSEYDYPLKERVVFEEPNGERIVMTERFVSVAFNTGLEDETFAFEPPENATVEEW